jgi:hypothetical protein
MTHSFVVMMVGVPGPDGDAIMLTFGKLPVLRARTGAGASAAGEPADDGVDTAGEAIVSAQQIADWRIGLVGKAVYHEHEDS